MQIVTPFKGEIYYVMFKDSLLILVGYNSLLHSVALKNKGKLSEVNRVKHC